MKKKLFMFSLLAIVTTSFLLMSCNENKAPIKDDNTGNDNTDTGGNDNKDDTPTPTPTGNIVFNKENTPNLVAKTIGLDTPDVYIKEKGVSDVINNVTFNYSYDDKKITGMCLAKDYDKGFFNAKCYQFKRSSTTDLDNIRIYTSEEVTVSKIDVNYVFIRENYAPDAMSIYLGDVKGDYDYDSAVVKEIDTMYGAQGKEKPMSQVTYTYTFPSTATKGKLYFNNDTSTYINFNNITIYA